MAISSSCRAWAPAWRGARSSYAGAGRRARGGAGSMSEDGTADAHPRVAFVTGASRGIGRAVAVELARLGHPVACGYGSDADAAAETVAAAEAHGVKALAVA